MSSRIKNSRILITVFKEFEIPIIGASKKKRFYTEIPVDRFDVEGILFELECRLGILLEETENNQINSPLDVIQSVRARVLA